MQRSFPLAVLAIDVHQGRCFRCGKPAHAIWSICGDGKNRLLCADCDLLVNRLALEWVGFSSGWVTRKFNVYKQRVDACQFCIKT